MKTEKLASNLFFSVLLLTLLFGRSFMGIYIFQFRLGELAVGFAFLSVFVFLYNFNKFKKIYGEKVIYSNLLIILFFLLTSFISDARLNALYTYKSSSYIWSIFIIYTGYFFFNYFVFNKFKVTVLKLSLIYLYILQTIHYPNFIRTFFQNYSDKWDFSKASSIALFFIITILLSNKFMFYQKFSIDFFFLSSALFLPLFLFMSRGSFLGVLVFILFELFKYRKIILDNKLRYIIVFIISIFIFVQSTYNLLGRPELEEIGPVDAVTEIIERKNTKAIFLSFYIDENRLRSLDGNINWRLDIWQDVIYDSIQNQKVLLGHGYKTMIPTMNTFERMGWDNTNENVHNFILNIYARGGIFQLMLFIFFYFSILLKKKDKEYNIQTISLTVPLFAISFFDSSMENAHFPIIFYLFLCYFFLDENNNIKSK